MKILLCGANGYIGSRLFDKFSDKYEIYPIDNFLKKQTKLDFVKQADYRDLSEEFLNKFDICLWVCGHSSVQQSISDPVGSFENNTIGLINLSQKFDGTIIYASSGSLYNNLNTHCDEKQTSYNATNTYDFSKFVTDEYFKLNCKKYISLRFGTVNGASKSFRDELMLNKMSLDAHNYKIINLSNPDALRPILFIEDLVNSYEFIIKNHKDLRNNVFNLCSLNLSIGEYANITKNFFGSEIKLNNNTKTYSFSMSNEKFRNVSNLNFTDDVNKILSNIQTILN